MIVSNPLLQLLMQAAAVEQEDRGPLMAPPLDEAWHDLGISEQVRRGDLAVALLAQLARAVPDVMVDAMLAVELVKGETVETHLRRQLSAAVSALAGTPPLEDPELLADAFRPKKQEPGWERKGIEGLKPGAAIVYLGRNGYDRDRLFSEEQAVLHPGDLCEIKELRVGGCSSQVLLRDRPGIHNTVMFADADQLPEIRLAWRRFARRGGTIEALRAQWAELWDAPWRELVEAAARAIDSDDLTPVERRDLAEDRAALHRFHGGAA